MKTKAIFPQTKNKIYLNTAACGLMSTAVLEQKQKDNERLFELGNDFMREEDDILAETKELIHNIFNADRDRIAIASNFSLAFNSILESISTSTRFLCLTEDYPSVLLPIKSRGFDCTYMSISADIENDIYENVKKHKPDVLALSKTQYLNGICIKTSFFQILKKDFPNLKILVDATQYLGIEEFDFRNSGIDLLIASGYKWLNAGLGTAIVMISDAFYDVLEPKQIGSNSVKDKIKKTTKPMGFLEPGHYNLVAILSLKTALNLHYYEIGIKPISKHINDLTQRALESFKERNLLDESVSKRNKASVIYMLDINQNRFQEFEDANIKLSQRGNGLRVSFHYYNDFDDLERFLDFLDQ